MTENGVIESRILGMFCIQTKMFLGGEPSTSMPSPERLSVTLTGRLTLTFKIPKVSF